MPTTTPKISLRKPAGADLVNVTFDIGDNMDKIDARLGEKKQYRRTVGSMAQTTAGNPITGAGTTTADLILKAVVGDWIEVGCSGIWDNTAGAGYLDIWSRLAGVAVNSWGGNSIAAPVAGHQGVIAWYGLQAVYTPFGGTVIRQVAAGDIDGSGNVTLTPFGVTSAGVKTISGTPATPFVWHAINHGNP